MKFSIYYASELLQSKLDKFYTPVMREIYSNDLECLSCVSDRINNSPRAGKRMESFNFLKGGFTGDYVIVGFAPYQIAIDFEDREIIILDVYEF